jgi:5-methylthioadenosine/S-adenosylhomocysteine deaminase
MQAVDLVIEAGWIIPIVPAGIVLTDYAIVVDAGKIIAVVPRNEAERRFRAQEKLSLNKHILTPGLINAHAHIAMSLFRGYADDLPLQRWLESRIWPTEAKYVSEQFVKEGAELAIAEMIRSGTTCFSDMYFFPDQTAEVARHAHIRCQIAFPILEFPSAWAVNADDYIRKGLALYDSYRAHPLITLCFGPHAPYTVSDETFARIAPLATELQAGIQIHLHETADEISQSMNNCGRRPLQRLSDLGILTPQTQCVHMTQVNDEDIELLVTSGAHIVHCPESNLKLASGFCPVARLMDANINVAIGTDSCASNNNLDLFGELHTAALLAKAVADDAAALNSHQALAMATINGAKALNIDDQVGSLEVGKVADIIAIALDELEQMPLYDAASTLVYTHNSHRVTHSWVQGRPLMVERRLLTMNQQEVMLKASHWQEKLRQT